MTESEWLACDDDEKMLDWLGKRFTRRKRRLLGCATARQVEHLVREPINHEIVNLCERYADGEVTKGVVQKAFRRLRWEPATYCEWNIRDLARGFTEPSSSGTPGLDHFPERRSPEQCARDWADVMRDLFGPTPFRKVPLEPAWLAANDGAVRSLARAIYDEGRWPELPILADALEEAGCSDADLLGHCRAGQRHYRGCWVVDLILGKR
jgi:hypothetical protein